MHEDFLAEGYASVSLSSQQARDAALLRASTDLFVQETPREPDEIRRYEELALHLLQKVPAQDRAYVAEKLAPRTDAPLAVIRLLAKDEIAVAANVLKKSLILGPLDLLVVISATSVEHHRLVARRLGLSSEVVRALRIAGDPVVAATLDQTVPLPPRAAATSLPVTDDPAALDRDIPARRSNVPTRAGRYDPWAFLDLDRVSRLRVMAELATRPPIRHYAGPTARLDRAFRSILSAAQIVGLARTRQRAPLVAAIADGLQVPTDFVTASLDDATGEALAVLLKAMALDNTQAQQVFLLAAETLGRDATAFFRLCDVYAGMETASAETLVDAWRQAGLQAAARHRSDFIESGSRREGVKQERERDSGLPPADRIRGGSAA